MKVFSNLNDSVILWSSLWLHCCYSFLTFLKHTGFSVRITVVLLQMQLESIYQQTLFWPKNPRQRPLKSPEVTHLLDYQFDLRNNLLEQTPCIRGFVFLFIKMKKEVNGDNPQISKELGNLTYGQYMFKSFRFVPRGIIFENEL